MSKVRLALTIAGSDSGGGAGIQADLKTFSALGVYGASVITAVTAQNTREVRHIEYLSPESVRAQIDAVLDDLDIAAIKVGMLGRPDIIRTVAKTLRSRPRIPLVVDPVMIAKSGDALLNSEAVPLLTRELLPLATLITPNLPECAALLSIEEPADAMQMEHAVRTLAERTGCALLLKAGHAEGDRCDDLFWDGSHMTWLRGSRYPTENTHGTGCTLASAITAFLAKGESLPSAVAKAKAYIAEAIQHADRLTVGSGHGPVHHFHRLWRGE